MSSITWNRAGGAVEPSSTGPAVTPAAAEPPTDQATQYEKAGVLLTELYDYLKANARAHPALAPAIPALSAAVAAYRAGRAADPFAGVRTVYHAIQVARRIDPSTPDA